MSGFDPVLLQDRDTATGIVTLTLNRPERMNALTFELYDELRRTVRGLGEEPGVRVIVLTGAGAGSAPAATATSSARSAGATIRASPVHRGRHLVPRQAMSEAIIAALNGTVAGAGAVIAAAADF